MTKSIKFGCKSEFDFPSSMRKRTIVLMDEINIGLIWVGVITKFKYGAQVQTGSSG